MPGLDIIGIYTILARYKPGRYIEVGSGNSNKVGHKADRERRLEMEITSIDPSPRAEIDDLADRVIREPFERIDWISWPIWERTMSFLWITPAESCPIRMLWFFSLEVMPRLSPGVIVHIHDVYLPFDYPQFRCDRFYSEQYGLAINLLANPEKFELLLHNYFISEDRELSELISPVWGHESLKQVERHGGHSGSVSGNNGKKTGLAGPKKSAPERGAC